MLEKCLREYQKVSGKLPKIQTCYLNFKHLVSLEKVPAMNSDDQSIQPIKTWCSKGGKTSASCLARCDCPFLIGWESSAKLSYASYWSHDCFWAHAIKFFFFRPFKLLASLVSGSSSNPDRIHSLHFSFSCSKIKVVHNRAKADR